ncbi:MAG: VWA domain-containing protein, partial [Halanaerobacter sp.]
MLFLVLFILIPITVVEAEQSQSSYIWVANNGESTVSKIEINTGKEVAKYKTGVSDNTAPLNLAVDGSGNCWIVNKGSETIVKISADVKDRNKDGVIKTSRDENNDGQISSEEVLAWGKDEAVKLAADFSDKGPRAIAIDKQGQVWVGLEDDNTYAVLNPKTGVVEKKIEIQAKPYSAQVDNNGYLWSAGGKDSSLEKIDANNLSYLKKYDLEKAIDNLAIDNQGMIWGVAHYLDDVIKFDPKEEKYDSYPSTGREGRGITIDSENNIWVSYANDKVVKFNSLGKELLTVDLDSQASGLTGVSVDFYGYIWTVNKATNNLTKINSQGDIIASHDIGDSPISYGDLTGFAYQYFTNKEDIEVGLEQNTNKDYISLGKDTVNGNISLEGLGNPLVSPRKPIDLALVIDKSGSMGGSKIRNAKKAAKKVIDLMKEEDRAAVIPFTSHAWVRQNLTNDKEELKEAISFGAGGGTDIRDGINEATNLFETNSDPDRKRMVILLSDGRSNKSAAIRAAKDAQQKNVTIHTLGIGSGADKDLLEKVAEETEGSFKFSPTADKIEELLKETGRSIFNVSGKEVSLELTIPVSNKRLEVKEIIPQPDKVIDNENGAKTIEYDYERILMEQKEEIEIKYETYLTKAGVVNLTERGELSYLNQDGKQVNESLKALRVKTKGSFGFNNLDNKAVYEGEKLEFKVKADALNKDSLEYSASNLPTGADFDTETQTFTWNPSFEQSGSYTDINFEVTNGSLTDSKEIDIKVYNLNRAPKLSSLKEQVVDERQTLEFKIEAKDPDDDPLKYSAGNLPAGATFNPETRLFSWKPDFSQAGSYRELEFYVMDDNLMDLKQARIKVNDANEIPIFYGASLYLENNGADKVKTQNSLSKAQFEEYYPQEQWLATKHHISNQYFLNHDFASLGIDISNYDSPQEVYIFKEDWTPKQAAEVTGDSRELDLAEVTQNNAKHQNAIFFSQDNFDLNGVDRIVGDPNNPAVIVLQNKLDVKHYLEVENAYFVLPHGMNIEGGMTAQNTVLYSLSDISIGGRIDGEIDSNNNGRFDAGEGVFDFQGYIIAGQSNVKFSFEDTSTTDGTVSLNPATEDNQPNIRIDKNVDFDRLPRGIFDDYHPAEFMEFFKEEKQVKIYYKEGFTNSYLHYRPEDGDWTTAPGIAMAESQYEGYNVKTLDLGIADKLE